MRLSAGEVPGAVAFGVSRLPLRLPYSAHRCNSWWRCAPGIRSILPHAAVCVSLTACFCAAEDRNASPQAVTGRRRSRGSQCSAKDHGLPPIFSPFAAITAAKGDITTVTCQHPRQQAQIRYHHLHSQTVPGSKHSVGYVWQHASLMKAPPAQQEYHVQQRPSCAMSGR